MSEGSLSKRERLMMLVIIILIVIIIFVYLGCGTIYYGPFDNGTVT